MGSEWKIVRLGDIAENISRPFDFSDRDSVVFINTGDVLEGKFLHSNRVFSNGLPGQAKKRIEIGDILFSEIRPANKRYALVDFEPEDYVVSTKFMVIQLLTNDIDPDYFYLQITNNSTLNEFQRIAESRSGTFPQITFDAVSHFPIILPPLPEQRAIAHILGSLDDKIELNRQMNRTLEAMAQAIFKSWFVDFLPVRAKQSARTQTGDPVHAKAKGRDTLPAPQSEAVRQACGLPPEIVDLFPDSFEPSELGLLPRGWKPVQLAELIELIGGGTPKTSNVEYWNGDIRWFSVVDAPDSSDVFVIDTEKHITISGLQNSSTKILPFGATIISARGTVGKCALVGTPMAMNQSCYGIAGINGRGSYFTYFLIRKQVSDLQRSGHGSVFNTITRDTFKSIISIDTGSEITQQFDKYVDPFLRLIHTNLHEIEALKQQRDVLLPKLISGELRLPAEAIEKFSAQAGVPDVEAILKEAGL